MYIIYNEIKDLVLSTIVQLFNLDKDAVKTYVDVEPTKDSKHGDFYTNAAMALAKMLKKSPQEIASQIIDTIKTNDLFNKVEIAGPGFINMYMSHNAWHKVILNILEDGKDYGKVNIGNGQKFNIEYVSVNPTGPMHVGHARGAVVGDVTAELLRFVGYEVVKEYYYNDAGVQIDVLTQSVITRYRQVCGEKDLEVKEGLYPGEYLIPLAQSIYDQYGEKLLAMPENEKMDIVRKLAVEYIMGLIKSDLALLGIEHEVFTSEKTLHENNTISKSIDLLKNLGFVYKGKLPPPKGQVEEDWEAKDQLLFASTKFGDEQDRTLQKSDGSWTYLAADVGYAFDKINRNFDRFLVVLGSDHKGYVKRIKALYSALSSNKKTLDILLCNLVTFIKAGQPLKMSKRAGNFVSVADVVEMVGKDPLRFTMLSRKHDTDMEFDVDKVLEQSKDNPIFYVQYAYARSFSVFKHAKELSFNYDSKVLNISRLNHQAELELIRQLSLWPKTVVGAATMMEPHRIVFYLYNLASLFHSFWALGREDNKMRWVVEGDAELTNTRLALVLSVRNVIASGLTVCGVAAPEAM